MDELRWIVGLNIVLAIWIGMLADSWKGRRLYLWMAIGFMTSVFGLALLVWLPKIKRAPATESQASHHILDNQAVAIR